MNILVLCDDYWHPGAVVRDGLAGLPATFTFDILFNAAEWTAERMAGYPVTLIAKSNDRTQADRTPWMDADAQEAFSAYVRAGGGLLAVHSGTASYTEALTYRRVLGGVFAQHPPQCPVTVAPSLGHPLAQGIEAFTEQDEHYHMTIDDPNIDVFLTAASEHGSQPAGWTRSEGVGRVCVLTPGHNLAVWQQPGFQTALQNALTWCAND